MNELTYLLILTKMTTQSMLVQMSPLWKIVFN